jgi:hypothetical protein
MQSMIEVFQELPGAGEAASAGESNRSESNI